MDISELDLNEVESKIYLIRGHKVMLDQDLAELYQVTTKRLNEQVKRNPKRFPADFAFQLTYQDLIALRSHFATSNEGRGGRRHLPFVFTEQGVAMLSSVLKSDVAAEVNVAIMRTFVKLREVRKLDFWLENRIQELEQKFDGKFHVVFEAMRKLASERSVPRKRIIGLDGEKEGTKKP
jgi:hypothetical protein